MEETMIERVLVWTAIGALAGAVYGAIWWRRKRRATSISSPFTRQYEREMGQDRRDGGRHGPASD